MLKSTVTKDMVLLNNISGTLKVKYSDNFSLKAENNNKNKLVIIIIKQDCYSAKPPNVYLVMVVRC